MNTQTHKPPVLLIVAVLAMMSLILLACSPDRVQVYTPFPVVVDITLFEDDFNDFSTNDGIHLSGNYGVYFSSNDGVHLTDHCEPMLDHTTRVELRDGYIHYVGTKHLSDGSNAAGTYDLRLGAENDILKAEIVAVDIPGMDLNHPCIVEFNEEMKEGLGELMSDPNAEVLFKEVTVKEGFLKMKIQVNVDL